MKIRVAELNVEIQNHYPFLERFCRNYLADFSNADITVEVSPEELEQERQKARTTFSIGYLESICAYRKIASQMPHFDAFLMHSAVVECDGRAFAFSAPSGTGKSTHAALWLKMFGDRARIINGDKPIFRFLGGELMAFGMPWCGKEGLNVNASAPLAAVCFLERGAQNKIRRIDDAEAVERIIPQVLLPEDPVLSLKFFDLLDRMMQQIPFYLLHCNMEPEAAAVAFAGMNGEEKL